MVHRPHSGRVRKGLHGRVPDCRPGGLVPGEPLWHVAMSPGACLRSSGHHSSHLGTHAQRVQCRCARVDLRTLGYCVLLRSLA